MWKPPNVSARPRRATALHLRDCAHSSDLIHTSASRPRRAMIAPEAPPVVGAAGEPFSWLRRGWSRGVLSLAKINVSRLIREAREISERR